jgi:hypothetical protein
MKVLRRSASAAAEPAKRLIIPVSGGAGEIWAAGGTASAAPIARKKDSI